MVIASVSVKAQKVYSVNADYKGDILVYRVDADYKAGDNDGNWFFTDAEDKAQLSLSVDNILGDDNLQVYRGYGAQDQIFTQLLPQRTFKVGFSYKVN